jgi:glycosyltransferase involved in cell wall biosynthesis
MTVTIPLGGFNRSGGVRTLVRLANAMAARGWSVRIVVPDYAVGSPFDLAPAIVVQTVATAGPAALRVASYYLRLAVVAARGADVCLANFYLTAWCAWTSRLLHPRTRAVYFLQGDEAESHGRLSEAPGPSRWLRAWLARISYRLPLPMWCVSEWLRAQVRRPDALVVGQGIDLDAFRDRGLRKAEHGLVVGAIGSRARTKGFGDIVGAIASMAAAPFSLLVAAADRVDIPANVTARVRAAAGDAAMAGFYNDCDVFVFASYREGFGLPPLEAMACGCAVVTTDCGGVRDFARHEENCLMVAPGDVAGIAAAIARLVADRDLRDRLARAGRATAAGWPESRMVSRTLDALGGRAALGCC